MNDAMTASGSALTSWTRPPLTCRLRAIEVMGRQGPLANMGEVELQNCSTSPVQIEYTMTPLQFLDLAVVGPAGDVVSEDHFSDRFSPAREPAFLRLMPGEKFTAHVPLLATVPPGKRLPGTYTIHAAYRFKGVRLVAEPLTLELTVAS